MKMMISDPKRKKKKRKKKNHLQTYSETVRGRQGLNPCVICWQNKPKTRSFYYLFASFIGVRFFVIVLIKNMCFI